MTHFDQTIRAFLTDAASRTPTPGGGSVAALVAALGASMSSMVGNLTTGPKFTEMEPAAKRLVLEMSDAIADFESLLEQDVACFEQYMEALTRPKSTEAEKAARSEALRGASMAATEVPLRLAERCHRTLTATAEIAPHANHNVLSDLGIAALLLASAAQSALLTADMNLVSLKDADVRERLANRRDRIEQEIETLKGHILGVVRRRLAGE